MSGQICGSGELLTIEEAIALGLLNAHRSLLIAPDTGRILTLQNAIDQGLFDPERGIYTIPVTGEELSFADLVIRGFIPDSLLVFQIFNSYFQSFSNL